MENSGQKRSNVFEIQLWKVKTGPLAGTNHSYKIAKEWRTSMVSCSGFVSESFQGLGTLEDDAFHLWHGFNWRAFPLRSIFSSIFQGAYENMIKSCPIQVVFGTAECGSTCQPNLYRQLMVTLRRTLICLRLCCRALTWCSYSWTLWIVTRTFPGSFLEFLHSRLLEGETINLDVCMQKVLA